MSRPGPTAAATPQAPSGASPLLQRARAVEAAVRERRGAASSWMASRTGGLLTLALGAVLLWVYQFELYRSGPTYAAGSMLVLALFVGTLYFIELGVGAIVLSMLLSPEVSLGSVGTRDLALRLEDLMIPLVVLAWLGRKALGLERREIRRDRVFLPMALFLALQIVVTFAGWGYYRINIATAAFYILKQAEYYAIFFFTFQYVDTEKKTRAVIALAIATAILLALYNVLLIPSNEVWTRHRLTAPFEGEHPEPSSIGGYFVLALALISAFAFEAPTPRLRFGLLLLFALVFVPLLYTLSRTSYVSFLGMILAFAWLKRSAKLFGVIAVGLAVSPFVLPAPVIERVLYTFQDRIKTFGYFDRSFGERLAIWFKVAFRVKKNPLFGRGVTYDNVIDSYYARLLIENGILGLLTFAVICWCLFRLSRHVRREHPAWWARAFALGYTAGFLALLLHGFSAITFVIVRIMEPFWLLSGIVAGLSSQIATGAAASPGVPDLPALPARPGDPRRSAPTPLRPGPEPAPEPPPRPRRNPAHG